MFFDDTSLVCVKKKLTSVENTTVVYFSKKGREVRGKTGCRNLLQPKPYRKKFFREIFGWFDSSEFRHQGAVEALVEEGN